MPRMTNAPRTPGNARPRILVTLAEVIPGEQHSDYVRAIERAGGEAIAFDVAGYRAGAGVPPHEGLLTTGGADVNPERYGEPAHRLTRPARPERDEAEFALTRRALEEQRPLLAICRGAQVLNVACGGSLLQHIEEREPHRGPEGTQDSGWHDVRVVPGTLLAGIAGDGVLYVNSRHHQAVTPGRLAPGLVVCGQAGAGGLDVIEAFEVPGHPFALGVQWHPERPEMRDDPERQDASTALFAAFVAACAAVLDRGGA